MEKFNVEKHPDIKRKFNSLVNAANIDICGLKVKHKVFGEGTIISVNNITNCITRNCFDYDIMIQFGSEIKEIQVGFAIENEILEVVDTPETVLGYLYAVQAIHTTLEAEEAAKVARYKELTEKAEAERLAKLEEGKKKGTKKDV